MTSSVSRATQSGNEIQLDGVTVSCHTNTNVLCDLAKDFYITIVIDNIKKLKNIHLLCHLSTFYAATVKLKPPQRYPYGFYRLKVNIVF